MKHNDSQEVFVAANTIEAYAVCNLLEAEGIEANVMGEFIEMTRGMTPFGDATAPRI